MWSCGEDFNETWHNIHDASGNCWKGFQGQRSKVKVMSRSNVQWRRHVASRLAWSKMFLFTFVVWFKLRINEWNIMAKNGEICITWVYYNCWGWLTATLASCQINAQSLPAHSPAADDISLIGCTSHDLTADWLLASTHFVDSQYPFRCSFGFFYWSRCFENVPFDNTTPIYLINLLWKLGLGI